MKLVTWNVQWGLGCDGRIDLRRIVKTAKELCDADVFCCQEVSHGRAEVAHGPRRANRADDHAEKQ